MWTHISCSNTWQGFICVQTLLSRISLTPDCSVLSQMSKRQHLEAYRKEKLWGQRERQNKPSSTHTHTCMYKYMGKTRPRPLNDKALPVWNNAHITTHHHHSAKRKFSVAPILSSRSCSEQKRNPLVRITFRQTRYYTAWLLRQHYAETGGRYDTSFHSEQTVEKHKQCLWFKAQANRKAECFVF